MARQSVSIRELQQNLKRVLARVEAGQAIEITRRRRPIAQLGPVPGNPTPWPDLEARTKAVFGTREIKPSGSELIVESRGPR